MSDSAARRQSVARRGLELARHTQVEAGFAVGLVLAGDGTVTTASGQQLPVDRGTAFVVPFAAGGWAVDAVDVVVCRPPLPADAALAP